jgi:hypothetical protein
MTSGELTEAFERTGWAIRDVSSGEVVGEAGRYAIRPDEKVLALGGVRDGLSTSGE